MQKATIWGVRGSIPVTGTKYLDYGGNTSCISLEHDDGTLTILDAGSGIVPLGQALKKHKTTKHLNILLSHLHIDHVLGLFSFQPFYDPDMGICLYGASGFVQQLDDLLGPPNWPIKIQDFPAKLIFHELNAGDSFYAGETYITTIAGNHPGGSILYRLEAAGKKIVYALDCELKNELSPALTDFAYKCDLLVWDATFAPEDLRPGWGHSTWKQGGALRRAADAKKVLMTHYNWDYTDSFLHHQEALARQEDSCINFAREGMVINL